MDLAGDVNSYDSPSSSSSSGTDSPRRGDGGIEYSIAPPPSSTSATVERILRLITSDDPNSRLFAAREIRRLTKTSRRCRRQLSQAVKPLVSMLRPESPELHHESALLALLNLAVKDDRNKISIVEAGALEPINGFLQSANLTLQEYAAASMLTLSASANTKPTIGSSGSIPLLVEVLKHGIPQAKVDAAMALSNLSTLSTNLNILIRTNPIPSIVNLMKSCRKSSKTAEKCCFLLESLMSFDDGRVALISHQGGVFAVVEVLETGSLQAREHAVGTLLTMCQNNQSKYRELILKEGVIPGLLDLTVHGTTKSRMKARELLCLLRDSPDGSRSEIEADALENIVSNLICHMDGDDDDQCGKAKKMLAEMVQVSMEKSLRHLQQRASLARPPSDLAPPNRTSQVSSK